MTRKKKIITDLREALDSVDITSDLRLVLIHAIEYLQREHVSEDLNEELTKYIESKFTIDKEQLDRFGIKPKDYTFSLDKKDMLNFARHFAEWGRNHFEDEKEITSEGLDNIIDIVRDNTIMYASREAGIKCFAETYSFNKESVLFNQLTLEQQELWRKEIENAVISGGEMGLELADDKRYEERSSNEDLEEEFNRFLDDEEGVPRMWHSDEQMEWGMDIARHFAEWQRKKDQETIELAKEHAMLAGMEEMKEEMMKDAREADVIVDRIGEVVYLCPHLSEKTGDKARIIIVNEKNK